MIAALPETFRGVLCRRCEKPIRAPEKIKIGMDRTPPRQRKMSGTILFRRPLFFDVGHVRRNRFTQSTRLWTVLSTKDQNSRSLNIERMSERRRYWKYNVARDWTTYILASSSTRATTKVMSSLCE